MPKVEASAHQQRLRNPHGAPLPRPRFEILRADRHTYEFDRHDQSLRVSWSGGQTFLPSVDTKQLHGFLNRIYKPTERQTMPSRPTVRVRRHRAEARRATNRAPSQPVATATEAPKQTGIEFQEYNGWVNYPSWSVFTVMTSYAETYEMLARMASQQPGGRGNVRRAVLGTVEHWKNDTPTPHAEAARILVQDFVMNGIRRVEWTSVLNTLRGEQNALGKADPLTTLTYDLLSQTDWKSIVAGAPSLTDADTMLQEWVENQCLTWIDSPDARKHTGSVSVFAETVLDLYFQAVQWEKLTEKLKTR